MTISVVLSDANVLFSRTLRDYVLYAADEGTIEVHWSRQILAEMSRNLRENLGLSHDSTARLEQLMNDYIEYALVEVDPGHLAAVEAVEMDAKDRHVLAAALSGCGQERCYLRFHHDISDKSSLPQRIAGHGQGVIRVHAGRGGVDHHIEGCRICRPHQ